MTCVPDRRRAESAPARPGHPRPGDEKIFADAFDARTRIAWLRPRWSNRNFTQFNWNPLIRLVEERKKKKKKYFYELPLNFRHGVGAAGRRGGAGPSTWRGGCGAQMCHPRTRSPARSVFLLAGPIRSRENRCRPNFQPAMRPRKKTPPCACRHNPHSDGRYYVPRDRNLSSRPFVGEKRISVSAGADSAPEKCRAGLSSPSRPLLACSRAF